MSLIKPDFIKQPLEKRIVSIGFSSSLARDEIISSYEVEIVVYVSDVPLYMLNDANVLIYSNDRVVNNKSVSLMLESGMAGVTYKLTVRATTSIGQVFEADLLVKIIDS